MRCDDETDDSETEDYEHFPNMIYVYGNVNGNTTLVQIFMTQYWNVISFATPLTDHNIQCYVNNIQNFLIKLYDKKPIVLDNTDGNDTEEDECGQP